MTKPLHWRMVYYVRKYSFMHISRYKNKKLYIRYGFGYNSVTESLINVTESLYRSDSVTKSGVVNNLLLSIWMWLSRYALNMLENDLGTCWLVYRTFLLTRWVKMIDELIHATLLIKVHICIYICLTDFQKLSVE